MDEARPHIAADLPGVTLRQLAGPDDLRACVELQRLTWGMDFEGLVAPSVLKIVPRTGGVVAGAFDASGELLGFVLGFTGVRAQRGVDAGRQEAFHWSHMLAVRPSARDLGLGRRLKLYQRQLLRPLGVAVMEWTYDPLEARNAHLNLNVLGATVVEYVEDMYKGEAGSDLAKGLGTDRFIVSWPVATDAPAPRPRAAAFADAPRIDPAPVAPTSSAALAAPATATAAVDAGEPPLPDAPRVLIEVPARIQDFKEAHPARALAYRHGTRRAFERYLARGYRVACFLHLEDGRAYYGLEREDCP